MGYASFEVDTSEYVMTHKSAVLNREKLLKARGTSQFKFVFDWMDKGVITYSHLLAFADYRSFSRLDREKKLGLRAGSIFQLDWEWRCAVRSYASARMRVECACDIASLLFPSLKIGEDIGAPFTGQGTVSGSVLKIRSVFPRNTLTKLMKLAVLGFRVQVAEAFAVKHCSVVEVDDKEQETSFTVFHPDETSCQVKLMLAKSFCVDDFDAWPTVRGKYEPLWMNNCTWVFDGGTVEVSSVFDAGYHRRYSYSIMSADPLVLANGGSCFDVDYGIPEFDSYVDCKYRFQFVVLLIAWFVIAIAIVIYLFIRVKRFMFNRRVRDYEVIK